jgi:hypothetical protein
MSKGIGNLRPHSLTLYILVQQQGSRSQTESQEEQGALYTMALPLI